MGRKYKKNGVEVSTALNKNKKYKYDSTGDLVEATGTLGANEISLSGSKSNLRRMADMERNISILATTLMTTDGTADDGNNSTYDSNVNKKTRFKKEVRIDDELVMNDNIDMNNKKLIDLADPTSAQHAATKAYVDARESAAESTAAADATSKANAAQSAAISTASSDATSKANAAQAAAIAAVTNGAGAAFDTLVEIQNAMATDAELSSAISSVTSSAASTAASDATTKADAALAAAKVYADNGDANTTYSAGNGMSLSGTTFLMSGSYSGSFTATGDITAYSDESLKTNIKTIDGALGKVEAVRGVTFDRIEDGSTSTGVVAQELLAVLPEAVHTDANGVHSVAYGNITGLLIEAVKELSAEVKELKNM
tara:strand:- start:1578 stop:2690 length:1113 start_codon:yes stop_codon:yes gene_type:complete